LVEGLTANLSQSLAHIAVHADVFMLRGRLKFGDGMNSAPFPSCVVVWGADISVIDRLTQAFSDAWHIPRRKPMTIENRLARTA
jgi:hypothetical protein